MWGVFHIRLLVPQNTAISLNNVTKSSMHMIFVAIYSQTIYHKHCSEIMFQGSEPIYVHCSLKERENEVQKCWLKTWDIKLFMIVSLIGVYSLVFSWFSKNRKWVCLVYLVHNPLSKKNHNTLWVSLTWSCDTDEGPLLHSKWAHFHGSYFILASPSWHFVSKRRYKEKNKCSIKNCC